jgi:hypothetical protein
MHMWCVVEVAWETEEVVRSPGDARHCGIRDEMSAGWDFLSSFQLTTQ